MATCTDIAPAGHSHTSGLHKLGSALANAWNGYLEYRANRAAVRMLYSLDSHSLHDLGISRNEIESVVYRQSGDDRHR
jgi:uncharacterized protein YjiS (DUF1127 family)